MGSDPIKNVMKKAALLIVFVLVMTLFTFGCDKNSDSTDKDTNNTEKMDNEIVSVEEFMEYYDVKETDIPIR